MAVAGLGVGDLSSDFRDYVKDRALDRETGEGFLVPPLSLASSSS
jgi:hypothetical protein